MMTELAKHIVLRFRFFHIKMGPPVFGQHQNVASGRSHHTQGFSVSDQLHEEVAVEGKLYVGAPYDCHLGRPWLL